MTVLYLGAPAAIAVSLPVLMAGAWAVQRCIGNSGWLDRIWTFSPDLVGAGSALCPAAGAAPNAIPSLTRQFAAAARMIPTNAERVCAEIMLKMKGVVT